MSTEVCQRCNGEEVIWGGVYGEGDSNYFDPCPECMGFEEDEEGAQDNG